MKQKKHPYSRFVLLALLIALVCPSLTHASNSKKEFCQVIDAIDVPGKNALKDDVATITASFLGMRAILSGYYAVDKLRFVNAEIAKSTSTTGRTFEPIGMVIPAMKTFLKAFVPSMNYLNKVLDVPDSWVKITGGARQTLGDIGGKTSFDTFFKYFLKVHDAWAVAATGITALRLTALGVCKKATLIVPICARKKKQCSTPVYNDLPEVQGRSINSRRSCDAEDDKITKFIALAKRHSATLRSMASKLKKLSDLIRKSAPIMKKLHNIIKPIGSIMGPLKTGMNVLSKGMYPLKVAVGGLKSVLSKSICVSYPVPGTKKVCSQVNVPSKKKVCTKKLGKKVCVWKTTTTKKTVCVNKPIMTTKKTCTTVKKMVDEVKKMSATVAKKTIGQIEKLFKPYIDKLLKKIPIPGFDKLKSHFGKFGGVLGDLGNLYKGVKVQLPLSSYKSKLSAILRELP